MNLLVKNRLLFGLIIVGVLIGASLYSYSVRDAKLLSTNSFHKSEECQEDSHKEYTFDSTDNYELVLLCGGTTVPNDSTILVTEDSIFLKESKTLAYLGGIPYESPVSSSYRIKAVAYPRIFIASCYEGCGAVTMIELRNGPNNPFHYFRLADLLYRNSVGDFIEVVGDKIIVAGERKIALFNPETFSIKTLFSVADNESIGYSNPVPMFQSSVKKIDDQHIEIKVYKDDQRYEQMTEGSTHLTQPKEEYTKTLEI